MCIDANSIVEIEKFLLKIAETEEYLSVEYLIFSIRKLYLDYMSALRLRNFEVPYYLESLVKCVDREFEKSGILADDILKYMLANDINNWVRYYTDVFLIPISSVASEEKIQCDRQLFMLVLTAYILDSFRNGIVDIRQIVAGEKMNYETNQYKLSVVNGVIFHRDYFVFDDKAYLYNMLTDTSVINFTDEMPGFAKIITEQICTGDILLRLDERLALPAKQAISYSTLNFEKFYGPQFHFEDKIKKVKTIIVHFNKESSNKLLMVIKRDYDLAHSENFYHIELETLPYADDSTKGTHRITTFLHGMYYPKDDCFVHIDYTRNQYPMQDYIKKYTQSETDVPIDFYAEKDLHYKIWCVENGRYSREVWYNLMVVSLSKEYRELLDEILA